MEPPPISLPLHTMSYAYARAAPGSVSKVSANSGLGEVNAWCTAVQAPAPTATSPEATASAAGSNIGASTTHTNAQSASFAATPSPASVNSPQRRPISTRAAPSSARDSFGLPAAKNTQSPGFAPTAAASPAFSSSEMFLDTGPVSSPSSCMST